MHLSTCINRIRVNVNFPFYRIKYEGFQVPVEKERGETLKLIKNKILKMKKVHFICKMSIE